MGSFCSEKIITARKPHQCSACLKPINAGGKYLRAAGGSDGTFWSGAYHPDCREWEIEVNNQAHGPFSDEWDSLHEHVAECRDVLDGAPEEVKRRFPPAGDPA
ncbi:hypothetical protein M2305_000058 [Gluconobacter cerinus]|uniref:hypothetical protein n=1 Tax=Gluconobacter cerinus TaxID=38307 RepID=UPI002226F515|nr:hypothetical protein [Gluconobacter cerinus]MCW2264111.1 hypothetical protein [Gluconobacter cerinus]